MELQTEQPIRETGRSLPLEPIPSHYELIEVQTSQQVKQFLNLPKSIYPSPQHTNYVRPMNVHMKMMMGKLGTPEKHFFLAQKENQPVARLGFKVHRFPGHKTRLHFGFFECMEGHPNAVKELFQKAQSLYPDLEMMGSFHFRQEDPYVGILVEGFEHSPYFLMPYNPPYYSEYLEHAGLKKVMDLFTYILKKEEGLPSSISENAKKAEAGLKLSYRTLNIKNLNSEARLIATIFNQALRKNWGFEEFDEAQIKEMVTLIKLFIDPRVVAFAMVDGKEIGCLMMIPNYNSILKHANGRITPKLIWNYIRRQKITHQFRGYALGVLDEFQSKGIGSALTAKMWEIGVASNYEQCEISWVLSNNGPMNELSKAMGGKRNKLYRIYGKDALATSTNLG